MIEIIERSVWGSALAPVGPLDVEAPGDVRVLLVHHTASGNNYEPDDVPRLLAGFYSYHTGPEKGWPDLAYNFCVDRFGRVWETRAGSIGGPVIGSATGGNQGFTQLCCFIGDHTTDAPTPEAVDSMGRLLGTLANRYSVDLRGGATASFVSRGSNRHAEGSTVTVNTVSGHRAMSLTSCPGDSVMGLIDTALVPKAREVSDAALVATTDPTVRPASESATTVAPTTAAPTTAPTTEPPTTASPTTASPTSGSTSEVTSSGQALGLQAESGSGGNRLSLLGPLGLITAAAAGLIALRRRTSSEPESDAGSAHPD